MLSYLLILKFMSPDCYFVGQLLKADSVIGQTVDNMFVWSSPKIISVLMVFIAFSTILTLLLPTKG